MQTKFKKGLSLVELLVAVSLIAICITAVMGVVIQSTELGKSTDAAYIAISIARNRIERAREVRENKGYSSLPDMIEEEVYVDRHGTPTPGANDGDFRRTTLINTAFGDDLTQVTVQVEYKRRGLFSPAPIELVTVLSSINQ